MDHGEFDEMLDSLLQDMGGNEEAEVVRVQREAQCDDVHSVKPPPHGHHSQPPTYRDDSKASEVVGVMREVECDHEHCVNSPPDDHHTKSPTHKDDHSSHNPTTDHRKFDTLLNSFLLDLGFVCNEREEVGEVQDCQKNNDRRDVGRDKDAECCVSRNVYAKKETTEKTELNGLKSLTTTTAAPLGTQEKLRHKPLLLYRNVCFKTRPAARSLKEGPRPSQSLKFILGKDQRLQLQEGQGLWRDREELRPDRQSNTVEGSSTREKGCQTPQLYVTQPPLMTEVAPTDQDSAKIIVPLGRTGLSITLPKNAPTNFASFLTPLKDQQKAQVESQPHTMGSKRPKLSSPVPNQTPSYFPLTDNCHIQKEHQTTLSDDNLGVKTIELKESHKIIKLDVKQTKENKIIQKNTGVSNSSSVSLPAMSVRQITASEPQQAIIEVHSVGVGDGGTVKVVGPTTTCVLGAPPCSTPSHLQLAEEGVLLTPIPGCGGGHRGRLQGSQWLAVKRTIQQAAPLRTRTGPCPTTSQPAGQSQGQENPVPLQEENWMAQEEQHIARKEELSSKVIAIQDGNGNTHSTGGNKGLVPHTTGHTCSTSHPATLSCSHTAAMQHHAPSTSPNCLIVSEVIHQQTSNDQDQLISQRVTRALQPQPTPSILTAHSTLPHHHTQEPVGCVCKDRECGRGQTCRCMGVGKRCGCLCGCQGLQCTNLHNLLKLLRNLPITRDPCLMHNFRSYTVGSLRSLLWSLVVVPCCGQSVPLREVVPGDMPCPCCTLTLTYSWCSHHLHLRTLCPRNHCPHCATCRPARHSHCGRCDDCTPHEDVCASCGYNKQPLTPHPQGGLTHTGSGHSQGPVSFTLP